MDNHLRLAVGMGMDPVQAITMCTLNAAECFGLRNKGAIAPGRDADFILVDDLKAFRVRKVFTAGRLIAEDGRVLIPLDDAAAGAPSHSIPPQAAGRGCPVLACPYRKSPCHRH